MGQLELIFLKKIKIIQLVEKCFFKKENLEYIHELPNSLQYEVQSEFLNLNFLFFVLVLKNLRTQQVKEEETLNLIFVFMIVVFYF